MEGAEALLRARWVGVIVDGAAWVVPGCALERGVAEESAEGLPRRLGWGIVVDVRLVVFEEEIFFFREGVWFQGYFEIVDGFGWSLDCGIFGFVDGR